MHSSEGLSPTHEMYLKVLYQLEQEHEIARVRDMAKGLGVKPGTVSAVLKKLEVNSLVIHDHYGAVKLTPAGLRVAECVVHRFEIIKQILTDAFCLDVETAELDACMMEHAVSPATINRMELFLQLVNTKNIDVSAMHTMTSHHQPEHCSECAETGKCQAEAAVDVQNN